MRTTNAGLTTALSFNSRFAANLYTFYFATGTVRWTDGSQDLSYGGNTWLATGPVITRNTSRCTAGLQVDTLELVLAPKGATLNGLNLRPAALAGFFDNVRVVAQRAYMTTYGTIPLPVTVFDGLVVGVRPSSTAVTLTVKSVVSLMGRPLPNRIIQPQCPYTVYDTQCGLSAASFTDARTVAAGTTANSVVINTSSTNANVGAVLKVTDAASPYYQQQRTISVVAGTTLTLASPFPGVMANGTTVSIVKACDKTRATCRVFSNIGRFGGFPDAPKPENWSK